MVQIWLWHVDLLLREQILGKLKAWQAIMEDQRNVLMAMRHFG